MYNINTGQARTDLYGINKGAAQVIDLSPLREQNKLNAIHEENAAKERAAKEDKLISDISSLSKGDVRPNDLPYFADKQKQLVDFVRNAYKDSKGGHLPIDAQLQFESMKNDIMQQALVSKDAREQAEALHKQAILNPDVYDDPEEVKKLNDFLYSHQYAGKWNDIPTLTKRFDYGAHVYKNLLPAASKILKNNLEQGKGEFTLPEAENMIATDLHDPIKYRSMQKEFTDAQDKMGATTPEEYAKKLYAPQLVAKTSPKLSKWEVYGGDGGGSVKTTPVVVQPYSNGDIELSVPNKSNEAIEIGTGGDKIKLVSPTVEYKNGQWTGKAINLDRKAENDKLEAKHLNQVAALDKALAEKKIDIEERIALLPEKDHSKKAEIIKEGEASAKAIQNEKQNLENSYAKSLKDVNVKLTSKQAHEAFIKLTNATPGDVLEGKHPAHVNRQVAPTLERKDSNFTESSKEAAKQNKVKKGDIVDGYEYLGGDIKDSKNWKKK